MQYLSRLVHCGFDETRESSKTKPLRLHPQGYNMLSRVNALTLSLAVCLFLLGGTSQAQQLGFSIDGGATFSNQFNANLGTTTVDVFLNDSPTAPALGAGLASFGFDVQHNTGTGTVTAISPTSPFTPNPAAPVTLRADGGTIEAGALFPLPTGTSIPLASIDFNATSAGTTTFVFSDLDTAPITGDNIVTGSFATIDSLVFADNPSFTLTTGVPEPGSAMLLVAACGGFLLRRKR